MSGLGKRILAIAKAKRLMDGSGGEDPVTKDKTKKIIKVDKSTINPDELISVEDFINERKSLEDWKHEKHTTGKLAASVTSSMMSIQSKDELRNLTEAEMMTEIFNIVKSHGIKSYIQMNTNLGTLSVILFSNQPARTCFSFLEKVYKGELDSLKFQKIIEGTIIQLSSAKSKKLSLNSIDKSDKLLHDRGGLLTIETSGDLSSFGFTLSASAQLDSNFSVFGRIAGGFDIIKRVAESGIQTDGAPKEVFNIESVEVISDAYREASKKIRRGLLGIDKVKEKELKDEAVEEKRRDTLSKILMM